jgi:hypothetical protein
MPPFRRGRICFNHIVEVEEGKGGGMSLIQDVRGDFVYAK